MTTEVNVTGLILAAGQSKRMGHPKMTMTWGDCTVIEHVAGILLDGGANPVIVVTGGASQEVETAIRNLPVLPVFNPDYETGEMISSVRAGLLACGLQAQAALIALGDQPQIRDDVVRALIAAYREHPALLIVPSYRMRRGHPWLVARQLWPEILALPASQTMRDFLHHHETDINYLPVDTPSVIQDIDTPQQYAQYRPE
jgi:molybdenum cofactor cytidylyltransferase